MFVRSKILCGFFFLEILLFFNIKEIIYFKKIEKNLR